MRARLVLFHSAVHSGCGTQENVGPFYCPADRTIYLSCPVIQPPHARARPPMGAPLSRGLGVVAARGLGPAIQDSRKGRAAVNKWTTSGRRVAALWAAIALGSGTI
jgi:hypothetical protein